MKSLSLSRPLVIMIIGLPGSGKSFFARQFADMFAAPLVSADFIRNALFNKSSYTPDEDALVATLIQNEVKELLKTGKTFVIDGSLNNRTSRLAIERMASQLDYGKLTIWVQTDEPTSLTRSIKRSPKRQGDALNTAMAPKSFERYKKQFSAPSKSENTVVISGKHTFATQARIVLKKLVAPRETVLAPREPVPERNEQVTNKPHDIQPRRRSVTIN